MMKLRMSRCQRDCGLKDRKSALMYISILGLWAIFCAALDPRLFSLFPAFPSLLAKGVILTFLICLHLFWLFGSYYLMLGLFTLICAKDRRQLPAPRDFPKVAVLYTTMHDFMEEAALSCVRQKYPNFHVFVLDDSLDDVSKERVDSFAQAHIDKVTVIRRLDRRGFKAGSLNHALRSHVKGFPYFAVADADSVLPENFIADLMRYFQLGDDIGYVQGSHRPNPRQPTQFARDLSLGIIPLWTVYYGPRNRFGNVIFLGHGGIIRYDVWEEVGEFPELVSEDIAFSTRAAQLGYRGYFATDVISYEDFPQGYRQLRRQQEKYIKGACEYLHKEFGAFVRSKTVRWYEKLDVFLSCGSLFVPVVFLAFIITYCILMPPLFCTWRPLTVKLGVLSCSPSVLLIDRNFSNVWSWEFYGITVLCTLAPALGSLALIVRYPIRATKMLLLSAVPYLSLMVVAGMSLLSYAFSRKAVFLVTGDRWGVDPKSWPRGFSPKMPIASRLGSEDLTTRIAEMALGGGLIVMCLLTLNVSLLAFSLALFLGPILFRANWETPVLRPLLYAPFLLICVGLLLAGTNSVMAQGAMMCLFPFHF